MSSISIETKKVADLTALTTPSSGHLIPIQDGNALKKITFANLQTGILAPVREEIAPLLFNNAGAHNAIYRGKNLGTSVTSAQWAAIADGSFKDLYIGDYWVISGVNWRIAAFDYYLTTGDTACNTHHVVIVPDSNLYTHVMNDTNITTGGYVGSKMYTEGLAQALTTIETAFGASHILSHRQYLCNAVTNGKPTGASWYDSKVELMTEQNVYGCKIYAPANDGASVSTQATVDKSQYPLFAHDPHMISNRAWFWLRDVVSAANFADVNGNGNAYYLSASNDSGVRPAFSIKS
jgi:hypothetical protein